MFSYRKESALDKLLMVNFPLRRKLKEDMRHNIFSNHLYIFDLNRARLFDQRGPHCKFYNAM